MVGWSVSWRGEGELERGKESWRGDGELEGDGEVEGRFSPIVDDFHRFDQDIAIANCRFSLLWVKTF